MNQGPPDGSGARDRRAKRDAVVAHAVALTAQKEDGWERISLARYLAKAHHLSADVVLAVIDDARELESVGFMVRPRRLRPRPDSSPTRRPPQTWETVANDLIYFLSELQTDAVHIQVAGSRGGVALRMRLQSVQDGVSPMIWTACLVRGKRLHGELVVEGPSALSPGWFLPLVEPSTPPVLPEVLVWRRPTPQAATEVVTTCLQRRLDIAVDRVRLRREICTPRELDLRLTGETGRRGHRDGGGRSGFPVRTCDRCGRPLNDAVSVQVGIGPECRKYYSHEVIAARYRRVRVTAQPVRSPQGTWLQGLRDAWKADLPSGS